MLKNIKETRYIGDGGVCIYHVRSQMNGDSSTFFWAQQQLVNVTEKKEIYKTTYKKCMLPLFSKAHTQFDAQS